MKPVATKRPLKIEQHGQERIDNYAWLRDENWKDIVAGDLNFKDPAVLKYIEAENKYKDEQMTDYKPVEKALYNEILSRIKEDSESFPYPAGEYFYYSREEKGKNYPILCRKKGNLDAKEQIYFDVNKEAAPHKLYMFGPTAKNEANTHLIYGFNLTGSMDRTLKLRDLDTLKDSDWEIKDCSGSLAWVSNTEFYYIEKDEFSRGKKVFKVNIDKGPQHKELVFEKPEEHNNMFMGLSLSTDEKFICISLASGSTEVLYMSEVGTDKFHHFVTGDTDISFEFDHYQGDFYIRTNMNGATDFKIMKTKAANLENHSMDEWEEYIPEVKGECIDGIGIYNDYMIVIKKNNKIALNQLFVHHLKSQITQLVKMPGDVYSLDFSGAWDHKSTKLRMIFNTPISPYQTLELDLLTLKVVKLHEREVPNYDSSKYVAQREFAKARDGQEIPLTLVHKKGLKLDSSNKAYVYAYGSYGLGMPAYFSSSLFSLIDRGFVFCIAHIRGGDDKGNEWYLDGKMKNKMNTFNDFIDSCEHLVAQKYTSHGKIAINGGSAGGMLMGAVANMRPDLFGCVVADVAFVDVINTISDETLPLTPPEWEEWGNPITNKSDYEYMMKYSPYDNIEAKAYPHTLYNSGISDEQVTYWEPTKMVAKLRELKTDDNLLLLNMKMHAGHAGASKKYEWIEENAFKYCFILKSFGMC